jgi:hypothetical protein
MKNILVVLFMSLMSVVGFGQNFEGKIIYTNSFVTKNTNISNEQWANMFGSKQEYYIKGGDYKIISNGTLLEWQTYLNKDNKLYTKLASSKSIMWTDASVNGDSIIKVQLKKAVVVILGYTCDELTLTCVSGVQKYYFNSKFKVDPKLFAKHLYGNYANYLSKSKALPLKMIIETEQFTITSIATEAKEMVVDATLFELPVGVPLIQSPY